MDTGNIGRYVVSAVVGIVLFLVSLALFPIIQQNADSYLMVFQQRCTTDDGQSQNFKKAFAVDSNGEIISRAVDVFAGGASNCANVTAPAQGSGTNVSTIAKAHVTALTTGKALSDVESIIDEHGEDIPLGAFSAGGMTASGSSGLYTVGSDAPTSIALCSDITVKGTGSDAQDAATSAKIAVACFKLATGTGTNQVKVAQPLEVTRFLSGLSQLIIRIIPILSVVSFLALSAASLFNYSMGSGAGDVSKMIGMAIGGLIAIVVILNLAPTLFTGLDDAYAWTDSDRLTIMEQFGEITRLIVRFVPTIFTASALTIVGAQNWLAYKNVQGAA